MNNRLLLVQLTGAEVDELVRKAGSAPQTCLHIDIERQTMTIESGEFFTFPIDAWHKRMVIEGTDMIGPTLASLSEIERSSANTIAKPWAEV